MDIFKESKKLKTSSSCKGEEVKEEEIEGWHGWRSRGTGERRNVAETINSERATSSLIWTFNLAGLKYSIFSSAISSKYTSVNNIFRHESILNTEVSSKNCYAKIIYNII